MPFASVVAVLEEPPPYYGRLIEGRATAQDFQRAAHHGQLGQVILTNTKTGWILDYETNEPATRYRLRARRDRVRRFKTVAAAANFLSTHGIQEAIIRLR